MKKTIMITLLGVATLTKAQKVKEAEVPLAVKEAITKQYKGKKKKKWEKETDNFEAEFDYNKQETSVLISPNGKILETEIEINVGALPTAAIDYINKNMPGKKIKEAAKITNDQGIVSFEAEVGEADYIFDYDGTFLKKEVEAKDDDKD